VGYSQKKRTEKVFSEETVKHITVFNAKHFKNGGFQENTFPATAVFRRRPHGRHSVELFYFFFNGNKGMTQLLSNM